MMVPFREATIGHLKDQLRAVEGLFRKFPPKKQGEGERETQTADLLTKSGSEDALISSCHKKCLEAGAAYGFKSKDSEVDA